jgi:NADPH:quinone reductase-like Zn-dependent oxidoreductase
MRAVLQQTYGGPSVLHLGEVDTPTVGEHDVLVQVVASPVTYGDRRLRAGDFPSVSWLPGRLMLGLFGPRQPVPGSMFAGRVVEVGAAVTRFVPGDDVFGSSLAGAYAERLTMPEDGALAHIPAGVSYEQAAATPYGAVTALYLLRELGGVSPGQRVLVNGAAGGVGSFAVQVAKWLGAEVTAVASRRSFPRLRQLGADHLIDYAAEDFTLRGERWNVVLDTAGTASFGRCRRALTARGRFVTVELSFAVLTHALTAGWFGGRTARIGVAIGQRKDLEEVAELLARGALRPAVRATFPLAEIALAHAAAEAGGEDGVVMVQVGEPAAARLALAR